MYAGSVCALCTCNTETYSYCEHKYSPKPTSDGIPTEMSSYKDKMHTQAFEHLVYCTLALNKVKYE